MFDALATTPSPVPPSFWRSLLFVPQFAFAKAATLDADCLILDLQDAVPLQAKAGARLAIAKAFEEGLFERRNVVVRINELAMARELALDLETCVGLPGLLGVMPTMVERAADLDRLAVVVEEHERARGVRPGATRFLPLLETPGAVLAALDVARAGGGRNVGLVLGSGDLMRLSTASAAAELTLDYPRNAAVYAARAAGIEPFDTPYVNVADATGLELDARNAKTHGFTGKCCVHPSQLDVVNRTLVPTPSEVDWARQIVSAQRAGGLSTLLAKSPETAGADSEGPRSTDAMAIVDGRLVGPPHVKVAKRIVARAAFHARPEPEGAVRGRVVPHALDEPLVSGLELSNPYEMTVSAGMRDLWSQSFYSHDRVATSVPYARALGLAVDERAPVPFLMGMYLACSMSSTHGALFHLGFRDARQLAPIAVGDTFRQRIVVKDVRNTSDGKRAVVRTRRTLVRVPDGAEVFSLDKLELYARRGADVSVAPEIEITSARDEARATALRVGVLAAARDEVDARRLPRRDPRPAARLVAGDVLLHGFARPLGVTANLQLSTQFLVTHPIHLDHHRFDVGAGKGVVVSGGLVVALVVASSSRDLHEVVAEELVDADNLRPVAPTDSIGAFTYVEARREVPGVPGVEELVLRTFGVKDATPSVELADVPLPLALLRGDAKKPADYDEICTRAGTTWLAGRIVCKVTRRVYRVAG